MLAELVIATEERGAWCEDEGFISAARGVESVHLTDFATGLNDMEFTGAV